ncbi:type II toxin-antitoxin system RelE/ParE family toxin [Nocardiopsis sp. RSe5-2]|uniref:Type II toxin-antitoxin system RelE/ParE family toxin n=1 Tax=Nocardiopsis endophytica TaxID=3018445 RepID=A0ABT4U2U6_9ACTN|nr:type II toxin-antitoxin system RelE/ParE family toxin [Nocardiopsis endophytica]MDA2811011.1 type II toxin-antitoxin system RelE/ParE family toxin [Nocardiopsis endophytica]
MKWQVVLLAPVEDWFLTLTNAAPDVANKVEEAIDVLSEAGPDLGRPLADRVHNSSLHNLKELRPRTPPGTSIRILFIFDPEREAILLVAGDKAGSWNRWYQEAVPLAEKRYAEYREATP